MTANTVNRGIIDAAARPKRHEQPRQSDPGVPRAQDGVCRAQREAWRTIRVSDADEAGSDNPAELRGRQFPCALVRGIFCETEGLRMQRLLDRTH
jgi:hypothetical protein